MSVQSVQVFEEGQKDQWNEFVSNSPWGDLLQMWQWGELKMVEGWQPLRLAVTENGKIQLAVQFLLKKAPLLGYYAYAPHGPVVHFTKKLDESLKTLINFLSRNTAKYKLACVEIEPKLGQFIPDDKHSELPSSLQFYTNQDVLQALEQNNIQRTGRNVQPVFKLMYDLQASDDELLAQCHKNTRYNIKYAEKKGIQVCEYFPDNPEIEAHLDRFYKLLEETQERAKGYPMRSRQFFSTLFELFKGTEHLVLTEAKYDGDTIVMNISQRTKHWSSSFYAGSNRLHSKLKAPYLLRWQSIQSAKTFGSTSYDFWGIVPDSKQHSGYSSHKLSFGGYRLDTFGLFVLPINPVKRHLWHWSIWLRTNAQIVIRQTVWKLKNVLKPGQQ